MTLSIMFPEFVVGEKEKQHFNELVEAYKHNQLIPYVGAGFSMPSDKDSKTDSSACLSWKDFLTMLSESNKSDMLASEKENFANYFADKQYEMALDVLVTAISENEFFAQVEAQFDKPKNSKMPASFADKFALFHQTFTGPWLTTNLDRFIEHTYPQSAADITTINGYDNGRLDSNLNRGVLSGYLFKLHGDAKDRNSVVFAQQQYAKAYGDDHGFDISKPLPKAFERLYCNNSLLFIGCSLTIDRPLQILQSLAKSTNVKPQFALLLRSDWQGSDDKQILKRRRLNALNIKPIYVDNFEQINEVFEYLLAPSGVNTSVVIDDADEPDVFVGRQSQLKKLTENIVNTGSVMAITENTLQVKAQLHKLIGHGGIGKTTLARQVLKQCGHLFSGCFEIRIDSIGPGAFAKALATKLGDPTREFNTSEQAKDFIQQVLTENKLLLLLDNVDSGEVLLELLPKQYQSCIIITSRDTQLSKLLKLKRKQLNHCAIELEKFDQTEALALFKELLDDDYSNADEPTYLAIAAKVDYLPIALRLAITTMAFGNELTANELLEQLEHNKHLVLSEAASEFEANNQERSILAVFDLSTPLLTDELNYCLALIGVCEQGPVPEDFLVALHEMLISEDDDESASNEKLAFSMDKQQFINHLRKLTRYSWCKRSTRDGQHYYELHQIVRHVVTNQLIEGKLQSLNIELLFVVTVQQHFIVEPLHFSILDRWIGQTDKAVLWLKDNRDEGLAAWAGWDFGEFCLKRGYGERFVQYCEWLRQVFVDDKFYIAMSLGNQALITREKGQLDEAMVLHQQEQASYVQLVDKAGLGRCYGNQALVLSNQALILMEQGKLDDAMVLSLQQQITCEKLDDKAGLSGCCCNQAVILRLQGQLDEAMVLLSRQQGICEELGDKVGLAIALWNQGEIFEQQGDIEQAIVLMEKSIELHRSCGIPVDKNEDYLRDLKLPED